MRILGYQPTRRRLLRALLTTAVAAPLVRLGRVLEKQPRKVRPEELPPIPWIGHC